MNQIQARAARRLEAIEYNRARIERKIADGADPAKYAARLAEYEESERCLAIELEHGRPFRLKGQPTDDGVEVNVPTGEVALEGQ